MESKKTFGAYILQRRKELGMTQREFAEKLYVTESAVSKWERGMSYPDITLLRGICDILDISEHELLTGSEDTKKRQAENLAEKYLQITKSYRMTQYIFYGLILLGCAIGNLAGQHTLSWFFIVLAGVMMAASLTLAPSLAALHPRLFRYKSAVSLGCFTFSLELLLLICCIYSGGTWFLVAGISVLFGMTLILLPFMLPKLPLPASLSCMKTSLYLAAETFLLILLLLVCFLYNYADWYGFFLTTISVLFGLGFFILPVFLRQCPLPASLKPHKALLYFGIQTIMLFLLLFVAELPYGVHAFLPVSIPSAVLGLALPWGLLAAIRYLPVNGWSKTAAATAWTALYLWLAPFILDLTLTAYYGGNADPNYNRYALWIPFDFTIWDNAWQIGWNVVAIVLFSLVALAGILAVIGILRKKKKPDGDI